MFVSTLAALKVIILRVIELINIELPHLNWTSRVSLTICIDSPPQFHVRAQPLVLVGPARGSLSEHMLRGQRP